MRDLCAAFDHWAATVLPMTTMLDADGVVRCVLRGPLERGGVAIVELLDVLAAGEAAATE